MGQFRGVVIDTFQVHEYVHNKKKPSAFQKSKGFLNFFLPQNVLSPGGGANLGPLRVPNLRSFSFISVYGTFFCFQNQATGADFFYP